ncbi:MAG: hypothetical protein FWG64_13025 [Firmicutes bacterium]|nr:hypothetical protein [Bacillota bacterium]
MASMKCRCGEILCNATNEGTDSNDIQLYFYNDHEWDEIIGMGVMDTFNLPSPTDVWRCPKCERMYIFENGNNAPIKTYALET